MASPNGWQAERAEQYRRIGSRIRRAARLRALKEGRADPLFEPFSMRLALDFQAVIDKFFAEKKARQ